MNLIRQDTDYALRLITLLASNKEKTSLPTKFLAEQGQVPYVFACKILQRLHEAGLIESVMGPKGGYYLGKETKDIALLDVIAAVQGPVSINMCAGNKETCERKNDCPITNKLGQLQEHIEKFLGNLSLEDILKTGIRNHRIEKARGLQKD